MSQIGNIQAVFGSLSNIVGLTQDEYLAAWGSFICGATTSFADVAEMHRLIYQTLTTSPGFAAPSWMSPELTLAQYQRAQVLGGCKSQGSTPTTSYVLAGLAAAIGILIYRRVT